MSWFYPLHCIHFIKTLLFLIIQRKVIAYLHMLLMLNSDRVRVIACLVKTRVPLHSFYLFIYLLRFSLSIQPSNLLFSITINLGEAFSVTGLPPSPR